LPYSLSHSKICDVAHKYKFYGHYEFGAKVYGNTIKGLQDGPNIVEFLDGDVIEFRYCHACISGMLFGKRIVGNEGTITVIDKKNGLICNIEVTNEKKNGVINYMRYDFRESTNGKEEKL
jgi:hypothetical protein